MEKTFAAKKFHSLIFANTVAMLAEFLTVLADNVIAGNMLGEVALSAITLITPFFSFLVFTAFLVAIGTSIVVSSEVGAGSRENADRYFSQGLILTTGLSVVMTAAFFTASLWLPSFFDVPAEVEAYVSDYFFYLCLLPAPLLFGALFYNILLNEGGETYAIVSTAVQLVTNIVLSVVLCLYMGIGGISLASAISTMLGTAALATFFLSRRNPFRFRWFVGVTATMRVLRYSMLDAGIYLYIFLTPFIMNIFLLDRFGTDGVVVFTVVLNVMLLMVTGFDGIGESVQPLISVYRAEGGRTGIRKTMASATRAAVVEGVVVTAVLLIAADHIPGLFGITTPSLVAESAVAIRIFALSACAVSLLMLYTAYLLYMEYVLFSAAIAMLYFFALPATLGVAAGSLFGLRGVWIAFALAGVVAALLCRLGAERLYRGKGGMPLFGGGEPLDELSYDVAKTPESIDRLVARVEHDLGERGVARDTILKIMLMIDSTEMYSMEEGEEKGAVVECTILLGEPITLILRDTGDRDAVMSEGTAAANADANDTSLNFVCRTVLGSHRNRQHILTSGKNRSIFHF